MEEIDWIAHRDMGLGRTCWIGRTEEDPLLWTFVLKAFVKELRNGKQTSFFLTLFFFSGPSPFSSWSSNSFPFSWYGYSKR